jgi:hypothetical protein
MHPDLSTDPGNLPPEAEPRPSRTPWTSACEPYREIIESALSKGRNAIAIFHDLVDGPGFPGRYASVKRFVRSSGDRWRRNSGGDSDRAGRRGAGRLRQRTHGARPNTERYRRTRQFVLTLGHSRNPCGFWSSVAARRFGPELHENPFAGWAVSRGSSSRTTCAKAYSPRTSTTPR